MKLRTRITASAVALALSLGSVGSRADWIGDFYSSAGAGVNATAPQAIATQSAVGYSGGGLSWRVPNKNFQPIAITPPSLKAGCGGIDAYLGGFSFPNKDAFVQALRNFGQAAVGYFFELALRTMAPEIAVTLDAINDLATRVNQFSINSCKAAKKAVDSLAGDWMEANARDASGYARAAGEFVDEFDATFGIEGNGGKTMEEKYMQNYGKARGALTPADAGKFLPVYVNVLRYALDNANPIDMSEDEKDLVMSLVGPTLILRPANASDGTENVQPSAVPKTLDFKQLVGEDVLGAATPGNLDTLTCDSLPECLNPTHSSKPFKSFSVRVMEAIGRIRTNIQTRNVATALDPEHILVLKLSSVPIYRAAAMAESAGVAAIVGDQIVYDLADYAAVDAAVHMVIYYLGAADKALASVSAKVPALYQPEMQAMRQRIADIKTDMHMQVTHFYQQKGNPYEKIDQLDKAERAMYANLNTMLAANARFGKRQ